MIEAIRETVTMADLFTRLGFDVASMPYDEPIDVASKGCEVMSCDDNGDIVWRNVTRVVKKRPERACVVRDNGLRVTSKHRFYVQLGSLDPQWIAAGDLIGRRDVSMLHRDLGWMPVCIDASDEQIDVLDIEVQDSHCYFTNGLLSHNTMYGDPTIVPGGEMLASLAGTN